ncbi:unnamed protein product [Ambrosiozyma monospora]|uniref:Unnamed protein product n=1 Tax=Ambrosiozyma monospora TaxID=43982 RepID=A0A9W7DCQ8_AMBMO|nr:unnamed protein product [Ambrosiozyma monospora]
MLMLLSQNNGKMSSLDQPDTTRYPRVSIDENEEEQPFNGTGAITETNSAIIAIPQKMLNKLQNTHFYKKHLEKNTGLILYFTSQLFSATMMLLTKIMMTPIPPPTASPDEGSRAATATATATATDHLKPLHPFQIMFIRMFITYICCIIYFTKFNPQPDFPFGPPGYRLLMISRGLGGYIGTIGQYCSLMYINLSDTITIGFLNPTVTSLFAWGFLGQLLSCVELSFGGVAFLGVVLIAQPEFLFGSGSDDGSGAVAGGNRLLGCLFAFGGTFGTGIAMCSIKKIGFHAHPLITVSFYALISCISSLVCGILFLDDFFRLPPSFRDWILLLLIGVVGFLMQYLMTSGVQREKKTSRAVAMSYSCLIWGSIFDWFVFGTYPHGLQLVGECVVVVAVLCILYFKPEQSGDEQHPGLLTRDELFKFDEEEEEDFTMTLDLDEVSESLSP